jgi:Zn ribbon nucleic-acid-binding protein
VSDKPQCPYCNSPGIVSFWETKEGKGDSIQHRVIKGFLPNAIECVDCGAIVPDPKRVRSAVKFAELAKDKTSDGFHYAVKYEGK